MNIAELIEAATLADGPGPVPVSPVSPGGVDPLGLRQINFGLMDLVLPNLNNVARRLRPFIMLTWSWRRVRQIVESEGHGGDTDERMRDFVDRLEAIYTWSQFLVDPAPDIPGGQALQPLIQAEGEYRFGGPAWVAIRNQRRSSTGLISPLNYGPGLRLMGWLEPAGAIGVFRPNAALGLALDAFEASFRAELTHPAFCDLGEVVVAQDDVRRWGSLWSLNDVTSEERDAGFGRLAGPNAPQDRREGLALVRAAHASLAEPDVDPSRIRRRMADPVEQWSADGSISRAARRWRRVQVRQVFRLAMESLLHWLIGALHDVPLESRSLAKRFLSKVSGAGAFEETLPWLQSLAPAHHPIDHLEALYGALRAENSEDLPLAIAAAVAFCIEEAPAREESFERFDRLPLTRAAREAELWAHQAPDAFMMRVIETWVLAQHAYWCVGRGLADARGGGKTLLRLKIVMDEGGWTLTPGTGQGSPPVATPDRLESAIGLLKESGRLP